MNRMECGWKLRSRVTTRPVHTPSWSMCPGLECSVLITDCIILDDSDVVNGHLGGFNVDL